MKNSRYHQFRYTKTYHKMAADEFLIDFFNDTNVQKTLQVNIFVQPPGVPVIFEIASLPSATCSASCLQSKGSRLLMAPVPVQIGIVMVIRC